MKSIGGLVLALILGSCLTGCGGSGASGESSPRPPKLLRYPTSRPTHRQPHGRSGRTEGASTLLGPRSKTRGCVAQGALPDPACTPGAIFTSATSKQVCVLGYSRSVRNVSSSTKRTAYREYGITSHGRGEYEVDHLVSLELGGSNTIANLWPEAANPAPGFHQKDSVENYLHGQVCSGRMSLSTAQHQIASNWLAIYKKIGP